MLSLRHAPSQAGDPPVLSVAIQPVRRGVPQYRTDRCSDACHANVRGARIFADADDNGYCCGIVHRCVRTDFGEKNSISGDKEGTVARTVPSAV